MTSTKPHSAFRRNDSLCKPELSAQFMSTCKENSIKMKPILQSINRTPNDWKQSTTTSSTSSSSSSNNDHETQSTAVVNPCSIVPSALLFEESASGTPFDLTQVTLESYHDRVFEEECLRNDDVSCSSTSSYSNSSESFCQSPTTTTTTKPSLVCYHHKHILQYKGETVCVFQTYHYVNALGTWGQSMTVRRAQRAGELQAHILHKGRTVTGSGWNAHERRTYRIMDILEAAAERYGRNQIITTPLLSSETTTFKQ